MKVKYLFLLLILLIGVSSCEDSDSENAPSLEVSQSAFDNISSNGQTVEVNITSNNSWTASTNASWCNLSPQKGNGNQKLTIIVEGNIDQAARTATITVSSSGATNKTIQISQNGASPSAGEFRYELPVIFHVLYKDKTDPLQYVRASRLADILSIVNKLYEGDAQSAKMNLEFRLANINPEGEPMETPGVEYVQWSESYPINCDKFMSDESGKYVKYLWDPNKYINVMIYNFLGDNSGTTTLGISHLPFSTKGNTFMEGLNPVESTHLSLNNLKFPYCASINSLYINHQSTGNEYNTSDVTVTLAHELGHYLGLHHVFSETDEGDLINTCKDTDYCEDTPSYDKQAYDTYYAWVMSPSNNIPDDQLFSYLVKRENCSGTEFTSTNIMDYAVSYSNRFTQDQRDRIRHVLTYSPLIPGPKKGQAQTRVAAEGPLDLPILIRK